MNSIVGTKTVKNVQHAVNSGQIDIIGMVVRVRSAVRCVINCMIGAGIVNNVPVVVKHGILNSIRGMVVHVQHAVKHEPAIMIRVNP